MTLVVEVEDGTQAISVDRWQDYESVLASRWRGINRIMACGKNEAWALFACEDYSIFLAEGHLFAAMEVCATTARISLLNLVLESWGMDGATDPFATDLIALYNGAAPSAEATMTIPGTEIA